MAIKYTVFTTNYNCPHCGYRYDYTATSTGFSGSRQHGFKYYLNSPIKTCKNCGNNFIDNRFTEYICLDEKGRNNYFNNYKSKGPLIWIIILSIYAFFGLIFTFVEEEPLILLIPGVALLGMIVPITIKIKRSKRIENHIFDKEIIDSLHRCENKNHLLQLIHLGKKVYPLTEKEVLSNPEFSLLNSLINEVNEETVVTYNQNLEK